MVVEGFAPTVSGKVKNRKNRLNAKKQIEIQTRKLLKPSIDAGFYGKTNLRNNRAKFNEKQAGNRPR